MSRINTVNNDMHKCMLRYIHVYIMHAAFACQMYDFKVHVNTTHMPVEQNEIQYHATLNMTILV